MFQPINKRNQPGKGMRKIFFLMMLVTMLFTTKNYSQFLGHEWINYSQQYYKFPITKAGIYQIDSSALASAGISVGSFDARNLQIVYHGQEIPLYVQGEGDGVLNGTDFIE